MADARINDQERAALLYLPHRTQVMYLNGLRPYMDYETGIVGVTRKVSRQALREVCEVRPPPQSREPVYTATAGELRASLEQLKRNGLIQRIQTVSRFDALVFLLPLASTGQIRPREEQPERATRATRKDFNELDPDNDQSQRQTSGSLHTHYAHARARGKLPVPDDFAVTQQQRDYCRLHGLPNPDAHLLEFVNWARSDGRLSCDWDSEFYRHLARRRVWDAEDANKGERQHAQSRTTTGGRGGAVRGGNIIALGTRGAFGPDDSGN